MWAHDSVQSCGVGPPTAKGEGGVPVGLAGGVLARGGVAARASKGPVAWGGCQLTASSGEWAVSRGEGTASWPVPSPGLRVTTISIEGCSTYHLELQGSCGQVQVLRFFFFFFFVRWKPLLTVPG